VQANLHYCHLSTDLTAAINEHRPKVQAFYEKKYQDPSAWSQFLTEITGFRKLQYDDQAADSMIVGVGDCLSDPELKKLVVSLLDHTHGQFRTGVAKVGLQGEAWRAVESLGRAEMLQLILLAADADIVRHVDRLIIEGEISIPAGEVRHPLINGSEGFGQFVLLPDLGTYGVRFDSSVDAIAPLRLKRLVDALYPHDVSADVVELDWQLRGVEGENLPARLEALVGTSSPADVLRRLTLARKTSMLTAAELLGIENSSDVPDSDLINMFLWKLGFSLPMESDVNSDFWISHDQMQTLISSVDVSAVVDQRRMREVAANYFHDLEGVLDDSLAFVTWALTSDHLNEPNGFRFTLTSDRLNSFKLLTNFQEGAAKQDSEGDKDEFALGEKNTLYPLSRGFDVLADYLDYVSSQEVVLRRGDKDIPTYSHYTTLRRFPLTHTIAFLDLTQDSRERIISTLRDVAARLARSEVSRIRNDRIHFRRFSPDLSSLSACLVEVQQAVKLLEDSGFCRIQYRCVRNSGDEWERTVYVLRNSRGREISFTRPSAYTWMQLPSLRREQYLMTSAIFADPNEMLRFTLRHESEYARMWMNFPRRRRPSTNQMHNEADSSPNSQTAASRPALNE
jgi:hypothetical protein